MKKLLGNWWWTLSSCVTAFFSLSCGDPPQTAHLSYQLVEEQPEGTFIADIRRDSGLSVVYPAGTGSGVTFSLLTPSAHFQIHPDSGNLSTSSVIDRDVLCPGQSVCQLPADVVVRPVMYFRKVSSLHVR